jgi:Domain of unknown function (4846)
MRRVILNVIFLSLTTFAFAQDAKSICIKINNLNTAKELHKVANPNGLKAGDVFIHGGSPGHCFIVMNVIENDQHKKQFLLAQSFMPAQNIQVLEYRSPWFSMDKPSDILYGELISPAYLKKFY